MFTKPHLRQQVAPSAKALLGAALATAGILAPAPAQAAPLVDTAVAAPARSPREIAAVPLRQLRVLAPSTPKSVARARVDRDRGYQGERSCRRGNRPGTVALRNLLWKTYSTSVPIGLSRGCRGDTSEHYDGRALDWMVNSANPREAAMGDAFVDWVTKEHHDVPGAKARRLGIMYIIWRGRMWRSYRPGWTDYQGCSRGGGDPTRCHRDHVHISLNWAGAYKRTSWYTKR